MEDKKTVYMAVAGLLPENTDALTKLIEDMDRCVSEALGGLIRMEWLVSPAFSDVKWLTLARNRGIDCHVACKDTDSAWTGAFGDSLRTGLAAALIFPAALIALSLACKKAR